MLDLGEYALSHGLVEEFGDLFDGLAKEKPDPSPAAKNLNSSSPGLHRSQGRLWIRTLPAMTRLKPGNPA